MKDNIKIYGVKDTYIKYLSKYQEHLFLHEGGTFGRKYIGAVLEINGLSYFAPLSSFKPKHKKMKESVDLIKMSYFYTKFSLPLNFFSAQSILSISGEFIIINSFFASIKYVTAVFSSPDTEKRLPKAL